MSNQLSVHAVFILNFVATRVAIAYLMVISPLHCKDIVNLG
ncbi:hypothetical protein [Nostoc sp. TCL26-01]|nr:hypothetical protein [Nostoc sp. TCL26-01]